jgi:polo-like kinase 1
VVELYNHFEDNENVYMNLEVCEFGSINDILRNRYTFTVPEVQSFLYGICQGLKYLHSQNIIHRDLKLGNIFLATNMKVKIGDFGLACKLEFDREYKRTVCGTPNYIAPEVLESKGYHFEVDVWALGVMVYTLFFTIPPFETEEPQTTYQKIRKGDYHFPRDYDVPFQAIDLIKRILVSSPALRPTIDQILDSPFMRLGGSIPLGLPPISLKRPPSRKELSYWPSLLTRDKQEPKNEGNSFVFEFLGLGRKRESVGKEEKPLTEAMRKEASLKQLRLGEEKARGIICVVIEQIEKSLVFFFLNNGNLGVCDTDKSEVYTCQLNEKCEYKQESLSLRRVNDSGAVQEEKIQFNNCPHRVVLGIKHKELLQKKAQINIEREVEKSLTISKLNIYKDVLMVKFNNKVIQVVFQEKDGFIISKDGRTTTYFNSF